MSASNEILLSDHNRRQVIESLKQVHEFLETFSEEDIQARSWELLSCAFSSEEADTWTCFDRSHILHFYHEWNKLSKSLPAIDQYLRPLLGE